MSRLTALLDANVLYSYPLTALLLELAETRLYRPVWSADIHDEWKRSVLKARPEIDAALLERRRAAMDIAMPDACVSGYGSFIRKLSLPDPDDRHVLAAAIRAKAHVIVTFNERDFPARSLAEFSLATRHPDRFLCDLVTMHPDAVRSRVEQMLRNWRQPPNTPQAFISVLERTGLPAASATLRRLFNLE